MAYGLWVRGAANHPVSRMGARPRIAPFHGTVDLEAKVEVCASFKQRAATST